MRNNDNTQRTQIRSIALAWLVSLSVAACGGGGTAGTAPAPMSFVPPMNTSEAPVTLKCKAPPMRVRFAI